MYIKLKILILIKKRNMITEVTRVSIVVASCYYKQYGRQSRMRAWRDWIEISFLLAKREYTPCARGGLRVPKEMVNHVFAMTRL